METRKILNLADPEYRAVNAVSKSALDQFAKSPAHYKHVIIDGNRTQATPAMELGSAFDTYLLTPEVFAAEYAIAPEVRRGTKAWDEFEAANPGKRIIKAEELARIEAMARAVLDHPAAGALLRDGDSQVSYFWTDERTGLPCKGRADYVRHDGIMIDVKTTQDASPEQFARSIGSFRYHVQAAMYLSAQVATGGPTTDQFCFIAVEKEPPYAVAVYTLDPESLAEGFRVMGRDLERLKACVEANHFPAYSERVESIRLPKYAFSMGDNQ
jgi:exodeoxyribonuclease VIII